MPGSGVVRLWAILLESGGRMGGSGDQTGRLWALVEPCAVWWGWGWQDANLGGTAKLFGSTSRYVAFSTPVNQ